MQKKKKRKRERIKMIKRNYFMKFCTCRNSRFEEIRNIRAKIRGGMRSAKR